MIMKENQSKLANNLPNHPSFESKFKPQKPSIKVDYKIIHSGRSNNNENQPKKSGRKIFINKIDNQQSSFFYVPQNNQTVSRVKSVEGSLKQYESGKFIGSEYCPTEHNKLNESINTCRKGKIDDAKSRYQHSKSVENMIKEQNIKKRAPSCFISESRMSNKCKTQRNSNTRTVNNDKSLISSERISTFSTNQSRISEKSKLPSYSQEGIKDIIEYEHAGRYREEKVTLKCGINTNAPIIKDRFRAFNEIHDFDFRKRINTLSNEVRLTKGLR